MQPVRVYTHPAFDRREKTRIPPEPFRNAEQAWFWTMAALRARREGAGRPGGGGVPRPCEPDDIVRCLDGLYRRKRIDLGHARVLRVWGERGFAPDRVRRPESEEARLWGEAIALLEWPLRVRGIVLPARELATGFAPDLKTGANDLGKKAVDMVTARGL